jgi:hypothetical protein
MKSLGLSVNKLALELHVPATRIVELCMSGGVSRNWLDISTTMRNSG